MLTNSCDGIGAETMEERMKNYDYDVHHFDLDKAENRKDHVTDPRTTLKKAFEKYDKPTVHYAAEAVAGQILHEGKRIKSCDFASWMGRIISRRANELGERPECVSAVLTPMIRIFGDEFEDTRDLLPIGHSQYDYLLAEEKDPVRYQWIRDRYYGGTHIPRPNGL